MPLNLDLNQKMITVKDELEKARKKDVEVDEGSQIVIGHDFALYKKDDYAIYLSETIKVGAGIVIGVLKEESRNNPKIYEEKVVEIDYSNKRLCRENLKTDKVEHPSGKVINFDKILDV